MNNPPQKTAIWTIVFWYPPNFSGVGKQAHCEHREFVKMGMPTNVLTSGIDAARSYWGKQVNVDGINVRYMPVIPIQEWSFIYRNRLLYKLLSSISVNLSTLSFGICCAWVLLCHAQRDDIVRFEAYNRYAIIPMAIVRLKRLHSILRMSLLGSDDPYSILKRAKRGQILEYLTLAASQTAEVVVAICNAMMESCQKAKIDRQKVLYIPHGVDTDIYHSISEASKAQLRLKLGLSLNKKYILFVGSAIERKGIDVLIDAYLNIRQKMDNVELLIVGPDRFDQRSYDNNTALQDMIHVCKDKLASAQCKEHVHWVGEVKNVDEYMKVADVFCLPTRQEGFGIVIIEAMASGLSVVVSCLDGITTDIISSPQEGLIIPGFQAEDYAEGMIRILNDPLLAEQMSLAARPRVESTFSLIYTIRQWERLFHKLVDGASAL